MPRTAPKRPPVEVNAPEAAIRWFRERLLLTDAEFTALENASHDAAFVIAGVNDLDLVTDVWEQLDRAIANGETLRDFQDRVSDRLASAWGGEEPWRVETIWRTNVGEAYAAGRYEQMTDPAVKKARPYWRFSAILDSRTTESCSECDGVVVAADNPWWHGHYPPLGYSCRSHVVTLDEEEAQEEGITPDPPDAPPMEGFGAAPSVSSDDAEPDLAEYPPELAQAYGED